MFVSVPPISLVSIAKGVPGVGYMVAHLQQEKKGYLKKSTYKQCEPRQKINNQDPPQGIFFQQFSEKNRKYTTSFICERFHQSTEPVLRCFFTAFCYFVQRCC